MTVKTRVLAQPADEFNTYLEEEGLDHVLAERARLGQTQIPVRERFGRYSKVIVRNGERAAPYVTAPVGHDGEFVPASDPTLLQTGEPLVVQFLVEGKPIAGAVLGASSGKAQLNARTDAEGRATFNLPNRGPVAHPRDFHATAGGAGLAARRLGVVLGDADVQDGRAVGMHAS